MVRRLKLLCLAAVLLLLCTGCRVRLVGDPALADELLATTAHTTEAHTTAPPETEAPTTQATEPPTTEAPVQTETTQIPTTEATEPPPPASDASKPTEPSTRATQPAVSPPSGGSQGGSGQGQPPAQPEPPSTELSTTEAPSLCALTLDDNGGDTGIMTLALPMGGGFGNLPAAARRGWIFNGWWTAPDRGERISPETPVPEQEELTLYAHWSPGDSVTLHFDGNGGRVKNSEKSCSIRYGEAYGSLPVPLREGYDFAGWWTDPLSGTQILPEMIFQQEQDQTLYAHWSYNPQAFWAFILENINQQRYLCQQESVYIETAESGVTILSCGLIDDTDSFNVAANRDDPHVTDDWVLAKNPTVILKCAASMAQAESLRAEMTQRFPGKQICIVSNDALGSGNAGLYARLALCKLLYPSWCTQVNLSTVASELGLGTLPFLS